MKIPRTFILENGLEEKLNQLTEKPKALEAAFN